MATDFEIHVMKALEDIKQDVGEIKGDLNARVSSLESDQKKQWLAATLAPVLVIAHGFARKLGVNI